jgi:TP901 family phage tail tape measure protein
MGLQQAGLKWVNDGLGGFLGGVGQANRAMQDSGANAEGMSSKFSFTDNIVVGFARAVGETLFNALTKVSKAAVGLITDSVGLAQTFESMATRLEIAGTGAAAQAGIALDDLSEAALKVGGDTRLMGVSATGAAEAITDLLKAGMSVDDVMGNFNAYMEEGADLGGVLGGAIRLAAASELDMVSASNLASTSMTIFGINAQDITHAMDYIVRGADSSVASVSDIRDALEGAGPTLRGFGFTLEDSVDALSLLSNAGIKGAEAGTALRSAFTQMTSNKDKVINAFAEQGVAITDAEGNFVSFREILAQLEVATEDMTEAERANFLQTIAGAYGKTALTALINQGTEAYDKYSVSLQNAAGIEAQSAANAKTAAAAQEALQGNLETLRIRLGSVFLPVWTQVMKGVSQAVDMLGPKLEPVLATVGEMFTKVADSMGLFLDLIGEGADPLMAFDFVLRKTFGADTANQVKEVIATVVEKVGNIRTTFENVKSWIETNWPPVRDTIINVFGMVKDWIVANWPGIRDTVVEVFGRVMEVFNNIKAWVDQNWPTIQAVILTAWTVIGGIIDSVIATVRPAIESLQEAFGKLNPETAGNAFKMFGDIVKGVAAVIGALFVAAIAIVTGAINALVVIVEEVITSWEWFMETIQDGIDAFKKGDVKKGLEKFGDLLLGAFIAPIKLIIRTVSTFIDSIIKFFKNLSDKLVGKSIIPDMMNAIFDVIDRILDSIIRIVNTWVNAIIKFFNDLGKTILKVWNDLWDAVEKAIDVAVSIIKKIVSDFIDAVQKLWSDFKATLEKQWSDLWDNIKNAVSTAWTNIVTAVSTGLTNIINKITEYAAQLIQKGRDIVDNIKNGLIEQWTTLIDTIRTKLGEILTAVQEKAETLLQAGREIVIKLRDGFVEWWNNPEGLIAKIKEKFAGIKEDLASVWTTVMQVGQTILEKIVKGLEATWYKFTDGLRDLIANDRTGIIKGVIDAASGIIAAGGKIIDLIKQGITNAWDAFVQWLKDMVVGIFGDGGGSSGGSSSNSMLPSNMSSAALPVMAGGALRDVNNSRSVVVEVNANYANSQSEASIYYDVVAALSGARI